MVTQLYHRFTFEQRKVIQIGVARRQKATGIAFTLNVNPTSVSRELKRNRIPEGNGTVECEKTQRFPFVRDACPKRHTCSLREWVYNPTAAEQMATFRKKDPRQGVDSDGETARAAEKAIQDGFAEKKGVYKSLFAAKPLGKVRPCTAYDWLKKGHIDPGEAGYAHPIRTKKRKRKGYEYPKCPEPKEGHAYLDFIRFMSANKPGHVAETDFLGSKPDDGHCILNIFLAFFRLPLPFRVRKGSADAALFAFDRLEELLGPEGFRKVFTAVLTDNGPCFWRFPKIEGDEGDEGTDVFFCDSFASNQKGSVENSNGQLRRFFPRGTYIDDVNGAYAAECTATISGEPIGSLSGHTPAEAMKAAFGEELFDKLIDAVRKLNA